MPLTISDETLKQLGLTEREARIEIACRLYSADVIEKPVATRLAGLSRSEFEDELTRRGLPWIRVGTTPEYIEQELKALEEWRRQDQEHQRVDRR